MWHPTIKDELSENEFRTLTIGETPLIIGRTSKGYFAVRDRCSHQALPLSDADGISGRIFRGLFECPHHGAKFDPHTGQARGLPAVKPIETFEVKVEEGTVWVKLG